MSSEKQSWNMVRDGMKRVWANYARIENRCQLGMPDVCYELEGGGAGWLELKYSARRAKSGKVQQLPHFTPEQRMFLSTWSRAHLLWRIDHHWLLFKDGFDTLGHVPFEALLAQSHWSWDGTPNWLLLGSMISAKIGDV